MNYGKNKIIYIIRMHTSEEIAYVKQLCYCYTGLEVSEWNDGYSCTYYWISQICLYFQNGHVLTAVVIFDGI